MSLPSDYPRCKKCKWWSTDEEHLFGYRTNKPAFPIRSCDCPHVVHVQDRDDYYDKSADTPPRAVVDDQSAFTQDGSDYASSFHTGPDFGCVHWEAKEESNG